MYCYGAEGDALCGALLPPHYADYCRYGELSPVVQADGDDPEVRAGPVLGFMLFAGLGIFITANTIQILGEMSSDVR